MNEVVLTISPAHLQFSLAPALQRALEQRNKVSLAIDGQQYAIDIGGRRQALTTSVSDGIQAKVLLKFLDAYRAKPGETLPDATVRAALHQFLFAGGTLDAPFSQLRGSLSAVLLRAEPSNLLLANMPWELTDGVAEVAVAKQGRPLLGTLAALPFARIVQGAYSRLQVPNEPERLRVLYAVHEPADSQFGAKSFIQGIERVLARRPGRLTYSRVGTGFEMSLEQLRAGVLAPGERPHIIAMICHGRTLDADGAELLLDRWWSATAVAAALTEPVAPLLVLLIVCDQVFESKHPGAHSGALTFLQSGLPAVVAMQSSVNANLAAEFLGAMLDHLLESGSLLHAVAAGRMRMAPGPDDAEKYADWSFPALFLTEDAPARVRDLRHYLDTYGLELEQMARSIPPEPVPFVKLEDLTRRLDGWLDGTNGLRSVVGSSGVGKTTFIRAGCRAYLVEALTYRRESARQLLYVDLERHSEAITSVDDLLAIVSQRTRDAFPAGSALLAWPIPRGPDGEGQIGSILSQLVALVDANRMVLVFDNVPLIAKGVISEFAREATHLLRSLVIIVADQRLIEDEDPEAVVRVRPFSQDEVQAFSEAALDGWDPEALTKATGGVPYLLAHVRRIRDLEGLGSGEQPLPTLTAVARLGPANMVARMLEQLEFDDTGLAGSLFRMVHLQGGINGELATRFVANWRDLLALERLDLLVRDERFGGADSFLRVPGLLGDAIRAARPEEVEQAGEDLADDFTDVVRINAGATLTELVRTPGGIDLLQDIHVLYVRRAQWALAAALPLAVHEQLYEHGRWYDAYRLWDRFLAHAPAEETQAHQWLKLGKTAHLLGRRRIACAALARSREHELSLLEAAEGKMLEAALAKDRGKVGHTDEIMALYTVASELLAQARIAETDPDALRDIDGTAATLRYNLAILQRWWTGNRLEAITEMAALITKFHELGKVAMEHVARSEWADMQIDTASPAEWTQVFDALLDADRFFSNDRSLGDHALARYRLGRAFRRAALGEATRREERSDLAAEAYAQARDVARQAGDLRLELIAEAHAVEVEWRMRQRLNASAASDRLERVITFLGTFDDAWSVRVRRDALLWSALAAQEVGKEDMATEQLQRGLEIAVAPPLNPGAGTDARRAAAILSHLLQALDHASQRLAAVTIAHAQCPLISEWLREPVEAERVSEWQDRLSTFGQDPGGYHG